jgi:hypothetical protein
LATEHQPAQASSSGAQLHYGTDDAHYATMPNNAFAQMNWQANASAINFSIFDQQSATQPPFPLETDNNAHSWTSTDNYTHSWTPIETTPPSLPSSQMLPIPSDNTILATDTPTIQLFPSREKSTRSREQFSNASSSAELFNGNLTTHSAQPAVDYRSGPQYNHAHRDKNSPEYVL